MLLRCELQKYAKNSHFKILRVPFIQHQGVCLFLIGCLFHIMLQKTFLVQPNAIILVHVQ